MEKDKKSSASNPTEKIQVLREMSQKGFREGVIQRLLFGVSHIKTTVFSSNSEASKEFNKLFGALIQNLREAAYSKDRFNEVLDLHSKHLVSGEATEMNGTTLLVREDIALDLNVAFKDVFLRGSAALSFIGKMGNSLDHKIKFIYGNDKEFESGMKKFLEENNSELMKYLMGRIKTERSDWYSDFIKTRDAITHEGWNLPEPTYTLLDNKPYAVLYVLEGLPVNEALEVLFTRLTDFCEDAMTILLATKLPPFLTIRFVPEEQRTPINPGKYVVVPKL